MTTLNGFAFTNLYRNENNMVEGYSYFHFDDNPQFDIIN